MPDCSPDREVRIRSTCRVTDTCLSSSASTSSASDGDVVTSTAAAIGSCSAWLSRSDATYAGSAVSSARIAISVGPGLGVDADDALEQPLGRDGVDVAGTGHQVDLAARAGAVGEHRDRLGAADGVHLVDAEQRAGRQDRRVRQPGALLRRRGQRDRLDAGDLGRDDVHDHAGHERRDAAGDVEPDPLDRHHPLADRAAGHDLGGDVLLELGLAGGPQPADGLLEPGADRRVELLESAPRAPRRGRRCRSARPGRTSAGVLGDRLDPAMTHGVADRPDDVEGGLDVERGTGHHGAVVRDGLAPEVDTADHAVQSRCDSPGAPGAFTRRDPPHVGRLAVCASSCRSSR